VGYLEADLVVASWRLVVQESVVRWHVIVMHCDANLNIRERAGDMVVMVFVPVTRASGVRANSDKKVTFSA
jgi:hypothetical protein